MQRKAEEDKEAAKRARAEEKKRAKEQRKQLRGLANSLGVKDVDALIGCMSPDDVASFLRDLVALADTKAQEALYNETLERVVLAPARASKKKGAEEPSSPARPIATGTWSVEEMRQLARATNKFPGERSPPRAPCHSSSLRLRRLYKPLGGHIG